METVLINNSSMCVYAEKEGMKRGGGKEGAATKKKVRHDNISCKSLSIFF